MNRIVILKCAGLMVSLFSLSAVSADEPTTPATAQTSPGTNSTTSSSSTSTEHKHSATNIVIGKVEKVSHNSISIKVSTQVLAKPHPNSKPTPKTVTKTLTYVVNETPPVKIVTDGSKPTRATGSYADVKAGDIVEVGTRQVAVKNADGSSKTHTEVTGIDVHKHSGTNTATTSTASQSNKN